MLRQLLNLFQLLREIFREDPAAQIMNIGTHGRSKGGQFIGLASECLGIYRTRIRALILRLQFLSVAHLGWEHSGVLSHTGQAQKKYDSQANRHLSEFHAASYACKCGGLYYQFPDSTMNSFCG